MSKKIMQVDRVTLTLEKRNPATLVIESTGKVSTGGWSDGRLEPFVYVMPPADGIWEFDFVATPPSGIATQVITPISAEPFRWEYPAGVKGVKVYAQNNDITEML